MKTDQLMKFVTSQWRTRETSELRSYSRDCGEAAHAKTVKVLARSARE